MTKREKIILIIMSLTIIWGSYMLFYNPDQTVSTTVAATDTGAEDKKLIANLAAQLSQQNPSSLEKHMVESAADPWTKDPFLSPVKGLRSKKVNRSEEPKKQSSPATVNWLYSGYLEVGGKRLAIINGQEYEEGESLHPIGYYLHKVYKNRVTIGIVGKKQTFTLPLTEP